MGWIYETVFCTIRSAKWDNRGFLYGPVCPVYGVGGTAITIITDFFYSETVADDSAWIVVFFLSFFGSIVLEYATSWGLEKLFHAYWWDYSHKPLNINGRVCFFNSVGFGCAGLLVVYVIAPAVKDMTAWISPLGYEVLSLIFMGLLSIDTTLTVSALTNFEKAVALVEQNVNMHLGQFVETVVERTKPAITEKLSPKELLADKKSSIAAKIAGERERFSQESMEHTLRSMGSLSKAALCRVKGFRKLPDTDSRHLDLEAALTQLKGHIVSKKKKPRNGA